jgi:GntR family transcriptional regulator/MocR family aminotransferase
VLTPAIRISFMVLTEELTRRFNEIESCLAQTASKTEQIALCGYIRDGHIAQQTRRIRRHYTAKTRAMYDAIRTAIPQAETTVSENGLVIKVKAAFSGCAEDFIAKGLSVYIYSIDNGILRAALTPSALETKQIPAAVQALKAVLEGENT